MKTYLTLDQAAAQTGIPIGTLRAWRRAGRLKVSRPGRRVLLVPEDLEAALAVDRTADRKAAEAAAAAAKTASTDPEGSAAVTP